ncbi:MAG: type II toxin-antitoxin system RelE/ParE family toxin [Patescibacteria group bacterium]
MDSSAKFIASLPKKDRERIEETIEAICVGKTSDLDIKKLKGYKNVFRVRVGKYRVICEKNENYGFIILKVTFRTSTTYNF